MPQISINGDEVRFNVADGDDSLLRAALRNGVGFPHECNVGSCGACKFTLSSGEVETLWDEAPGLSASDRRRGRRLACQCRPIGKDVSIQVRLSHEYQPNDLPVKSAAILERITQLNYDTAEFSFKTNGRRAGFLPGQYALLGLPGIPGKWRAYSMSNLENEDGTWQFIIRQVPNGHGTQHIFTQMRVGDSIELDGPYGHAWLRPVERDIVCIAGGSGLAPMLSIASSAAKTLKEKNRKLLFFYGGRTEKDLVARAYLEKLPGFGSEIQFVEALSDSCSQVNEDFAKGFLHEVVDLSVGEDIGRYETYMAGPGKMLEAFMDLLMVKRKVSFEQIHFDRYS